MTAATTDRLRSVRLRTTAIAMATVVVVLAVGAYGMIEQFEHEQVRQVDRTLASASRFIQRTTATGSPLPDSVGPDSLVQVIDDQGDLTYASPRLQGQPAMRAAPVDDDLDQPRTVSVDQVGSVRVLGVPYQGDRVLLGSSLVHVEDAVATLRTVLFVALPVLAVALGLLLWFVVGRTLKPVYDAVEREDRLVADVSHELRTPIAGVRSLLESESRDPEEIELNRLEALAVLSRLESIADGLLSVARQGGAGDRPIAELVDLDEVALRAVDLAARPSGVEVDVSGVSGGQVRGNAVDLERMISNLVNNAVRHARSRVYVSIDERAGAVTLIVGDDGPGIPPEDRERIFERFTRLDDARGRDQGGAGLGLPIVRSVVTAHGGTVVARDGASGGTELVVTLPASVADLGTSSRPPDQVPLRF